MKLKTHYLVGLTLTTFIPVGYIGYKAIKQEQISQKKMDMIANISIISTPILLTAHVRLSKIMMKKVIESSKSKIRKMRKTS